MCSFESTTMAADAQQHAIWIWMVSFMKDIFNTNKYTMYTILVMCHHQVLVDRCTMCS